MALIRKKERKEEKKKKIFFPIMIHSNCVNYLLDCVNDIIVEKY